MLAGEGFLLSLVMFKAANTTISFFENLMRCLFQERQRCRCESAEKPRSANSKLIIWGTFVHYGICACVTIVSLSLDEWSLSTLISRSRVAKIIALMQQTSALCSHWFVYWLNYCLGSLGSKRRSNIKVESLKMQIMRTHQQYAWCTNIEV